MYISNKNEGATAPAQAGTHKGEKNMKLYHIVRRHSMDKNESIQETYATKTEAKAALKAWRRDMAKATKWTALPGNNDMVADFVLVDRCGRTSLSESRWVETELVSD